MASFKYPVDNKIHANRPIVIDPEIGGDFALQYLTSAVVNLVITGPVTTLGVSVPVGAVILGCSAKVVTSFAGLSGSGQTIALAFSGGNTLAVGNFVTAGAGNLAAGTKIKNLFAFDSASNAVTSTVADLTLTISGGADNNPAAGAVQATVVYMTLDNLD